MNHIKDKALSVCFELLQASRRLRKFRLANGEYREQAQGDDVP